ncbi:glucose-6-phosphate exchanger SLC37A2-like isoform X2 [Mya arenaria]|uniref:glucose-6-phosphate exchanger SLC37A2-like isoform X2 n=1 Tax=Mya arenaria TaxID=6604 RepID=UPI0022E706B9|nr:glucose-6-phosphate exchanger SLC37A2-like isoform X2 [Mya arenaria]
MVFSTGISLQNPMGKRQVVVFTVGWLAYASTYCLRKPLGVVKTDLETELSMSKTQLGLLDTALLLPYAVMQILLGPMADKFGARKTFGVGLVLSAASMSQCWPSAIKAVGSWFPDNVLNSVFGVYGTCTFAGGIIGTALAVWLQTSYGWRSAFFIPSAVVGCMGLLVLLFFQQPDELNIQVPGKASSTPSKSKASALSWLQLLKIPMLVEVSLGLFCLKTVRYCLYMWLPMYLLNQLQYSKVEAGMFSTMFEVGGVLGSAIIGFILDRLTFFRGRPLFGTGMSAAGSAVSLMLFVLTGPYGFVFNMTFLFLAGAFNCGCDTILSGSIPQELGNRDGKNAAAATVGMVNGIGSVGTFLEGPVIGVIATVYGWSGMFYFMIIVTILGSIAVFKASVIYARQPKSIPEPISLNMTDLE